MRKRRTFPTLFTTILFIILANEILAQTYNRLHSQYVFKSLTVDDGIGNNRVRGLGQDNYGFIWIGTRNAVCRFDGYEISAYFHFHSDTSIKYFSETRTIYCDSEGKLWSGGNYGICYYDLEKDRFVQFKDPSSNEVFSNTNGIDEDSDGLIWFTSRKKFGNYNHKDQKFTYYSSETFEDFNFPDASPERLIVDRKDNIYVSYSRSGLLFFDRRKNKFTLYKSNGSPSALGENRIERLYEDDKGIVWIGFNNNGFSKFTPESKLFETFFPDPDIKQSGRVRGLLKDTKGNFWIGTQAGLYLFDETNNEFLRYAHSAHPVSEITHNSIQTLFMDKHEGLWLGTFAGGVNFTNLNTTGFTKYSYTPFESPYFLNDKNVYSLAIDLKGNLWAGTENGGLNHLNRQTGKFNYYRHDPANPNSPLGNNIKDIEIDYQNNIWFATYDGGFSFFNQETEKFTNFLQSDERPDGFPVTRTYQILINPADKDQLFIGTIESLYLYQIPTGKYTKVEPGMTGFSNAPGIEKQIYKLYNLQNERVLIGTDRLIIFDAYSTTFQEISKINGIALQAVNFIYSDRTGHVWFDNQNKTIFRANPKFTDFEIFRSNQELPEALYLDVADDEYGNLWFSTNVGIIRIDNFVNNRDSVKYHIYKKSDNLQSQEFLYNSKAISNDGEIHFGGINGFNSFYPKNVKDNLYAPFVHIFNIKVENENVAVGEKYYGKRILIKPCIETDFIKLSPRTKTLTIEFAGLHYASSLNNKFKYILEGYDDHWTETDAGIRFANYSNLPPGNYIFNVHSANYSETWTDKPAHISIKVIRPLFNRWWFILLVITGIVALIRMFVILRERRLKHDKELLKEEIREKEEKLKKQQAEVEQQRQELIDKEEAEKITKWFNKGLALFSDILSEEKDNLEKLASNLISNIVEYVDAQLGGLFITNVSKPEEPILELIASYSYDRDKLEKKTFSPGEGEVGICYQRGEILIIDNLPESYATISSGLGEYKLTHLTLVPLKRHEHIMGVIELASIKKIDQYKIDFLVSISENIVSVLHMLRSNETITKMLQNSQTQTEELHAQEEEMRQTLEEMKATQEESALREEKAQNEINELKEEIKILRKNR